MCASYHVFPEENVDMREIISQIVEHFPQSPVTTGRVRPSQPAAIIGPEGPRPMTFGLSLSLRKGLLLNARSEGAETSRLFSPMLASTRCLVPANSFLEWTPQKKPWRFAQAEGGLLYMAGLYLQAKDAQGFVILTRDADDQVSAIHSRMPLLLQSPEYQRAWLDSPVLARELLHMAPGVPLTATPEPPSEKAPLA